jgi:hypothetical protein
VLDRPRRSVERIRPSLIDEQFAAAVFERAEVWVDGIYKSSDAGVEVCDVRGPVESGGVVGEVVVDCVLEDRDAEC